MKPMFVLLGLAFLVSLGSLQATALWLQVEGAAKNDRGWVNPVHGWSISYSEGWTLDSRDPAFVKLEPPARLARGEIGINSAMLGTQFRSADELADAALAAENQTAGPVRVLSRRNMVLADGTPAVDVVNLLGADAKGKSRKVFVLAKGDGFIIDAETFIDAWQELEPHFDRIINSFTLRH